MLAVLLAVLALSSGAAGWARQDNPSDSPPRRAGGSVAALPTAAAEPAPAATPTGLRIASIDVDATVRPMGLNADRTVEVPRDPDDVGWFHLGSAPGLAGSAVLLGHVDSTRGPAVFSRLSSLRPGATIQVASSDGSVTHFEVTTITTYDNADFPARKVYRSTGRPGLALVTCGGRYDAARGGYQANVVVYAALRGTTGG